MRKKKITRKDRGFESLSLKREHLDIIKEYAGQNDDKLYKAAGVLIETGKKILLKKATIATSAKEEK